MRPCPFCGSLNLSVALGFSSNGHLTPQRDTAFIYCLDCRASGPHVEKVRGASDLAHEAWEKWNARPLGEIF